MDGFARDLRYAVRQLGRNPGFSIAAILTLALGIAANNTVFTLVNTVFLRPMLPSQLAGASGNDPTTLAVVAIVLVAAGPSACWIPARRAARLESAMALRTDE